MRGTIARVNQRGFGFIQPESGDGDVFFHARELSGGLEFDATLIERRVLFESINTDRGPKAINVRPAN